MGELLIFRAANPHRPPDWRWQLAKYLQERRLRLTRSHGDRNVSLARKFAIAMDAAIDDLEQYSVMEDFPVLFEAWAIYQATTLKNARWELEARLLAAEARPEIARKTGLNAAIIEHYASIFFDVQNMPLSYITHVVIGDSAKRGISEREPDVLWKMVGYWCGPTMLDMLIYRFNQPMKPQSPAAIKSFLADDIREQLQLKTWIAVRSMQVNWQTQTEIVGLYLKMVELEKRAGETESGQETLRTGIAALLESLPWTRDANTAARCSLTSELERGGVGLRADEMLLIAAGQTPKNLAEITADAAFPPPVRRTTVSN